MKNMNIKFIKSNQYLYALKSEFTPALLKCLEETESQWKIEGESIIKTLEEVTKLNFNKSPKLVYVNTKETFSDPITLNITSNIDDNVDNLTHELVHVLLTENYPKIEKQWTAYMESLGDEPVLVKSHVMVHAIHILVAQKMGFSEDRIERIRNYSKHADYRKSWEIAEKMGFSKVVDLLH